MSTLQKLGHDMAVDRFDARINDSGLTQGAYDYRALVFEVAPVWLCLSASFLPDGNLDCLTKACAARWFGLRLPWVMFYQSTQNRPTTASAATPGPHEVFGLRYSQNFFFWDVFSLFCTMSDDSEEKIHSSSSFNWEFKMSSWFNNALTGARTGLASSSSRHNRYGAIPTSEGDAGPHRPRGSLVSGVVIPPSHREALRLPSEPQRRVSVPQPALVSEDPVFTPEREELASYLLGVHAVGHPTSPDTLEGLKIMTDIKSKAKGDFELGNPVVWRDIEKSGKMNMFRAYKVGRAIHSYFNYLFFDKSKDLIQTDPVNLKTKPSDFERAGIYAHFGVMEGKGRVARLECDWISLTAAMAAYVNMQESSPRYTPQNPSPEIVTKLKSLGLPLDSNEPVVRASTLDPAIFSIHDHAPHERPDLIGPFMMPGGNLCNEVTKKLTHGDLAMKGAGYSYIEYMHGKNQLGNKLEGLVNKGVSPDVLVAVEANAGSSVARSITRQVVR